TAPGGGSSVRSFSRNRETQKARCREGFDRQVSQTADSKATIPREVSMVRGAVVSVGLMVTALLIGVCTPAWAQGTSGIAGVVRDTSGGVLPGVTVEATSPVLIEKGRSVVTDDQGLYRFTDLLPGTYTVTFTLTGFSTLKREDGELTSNFTATIN